MSDTILANLVAQITKKKEEIKTALDVVAVTAATVGAVIVQAVTDQKVGVGTALVTTATTASLAAIGNAINTTGKYEGKQVFNTTTKILVIAVGSTAGAVWANAGTGVTAHTPV